MTQDGLFDLPGHPAPTPRAMTVAGQRPIRYAPWRFKTRRLCDDCVSDIHLLGVHLAPLPRTVRWRRSQPDVPAGQMERPPTTHNFLCDQHRIQRQESEQ